MQNTQTKFLALYLVTICNGFPAQFINRQLKHQIKMTIGSIDRCYFTLVINLNYIKTYIKITLEIGIKYSTTR